MWIHDSVVMYGCESWTIKKAEQWRTDAFELWYWIRLLRVLWQQGDQTSQSWRKSTLNIHWKDWCWTETPILGPPDAKSQLIGKDPPCWGRLKTGGEGDNRGWDSWMASPTQWTWVWASSGSRWWTGKPGVLWSMGLQRVRHDWVTDQQQRGAQMSQLDQGDNHPAFLEQSQAMSVLQHN